MKEQLKGRARRVMGSLCLSFGILAIANVETIWNEYRHADPQDDDRLSVGAQTRSTAAATKERAKIAAKLGLNQKPGVFKPLQSELSQTLEQDELKDANPYASLGTLDPLHQIIQKGVTKFKRETFRSSTYQDESGYDMIHYQIEHPDGRTSEILAYLDGTPLSSRDIGAPDERAPVVVFLVAQEKDVSYTLFRSGHQDEQSNLEPAKAQNLVAERLGEGVPFLSVSR